MNKWKIIAGIAVGSMALTPTTAGAVGWIYSSENMKDSYKGEWTETQAGMWMLLPTSGWELGKRPVEEETETEADQTKAETAAADPAQNEAESAAADPTQTEAETSAVEETEAETEADPAASLLSYAPECVEYEAYKTDEDLQMEIAHLVIEDAENSDMLSYKLLSDIFKGMENEYLVYCNGIDAIHFDLDQTENLVIPEAIADGEGGFIPGCTLISVSSPRRETREHFADELFCSIMPYEGCETHYFDGNVFYPAGFDEWRVDLTAKEYAKLVTHKKFITDNDDTPSEASAFYLKDLNFDGIAELLIRYKGTIKEDEVFWTDEDLRSMGFENIVWDYAVYGLKKTDVKLLHTEEGGSPYDEVFLFPDMGIVEFDVTNNGDFNYYGIEVAVDEDVSKLDAEDLQGYYEDEYDYVPIGPDFIQNSADASVKISQSMQQIWKDYQS